MRAPHVRVDMQLTTEKAQTCHTLPSSSHTPHRHTLCWWSYETHHACSTHEGGFAAENSEAADLPVLTQHLTHNTSPHALLVEPRDA